MKVEGSCHCGKIAYEAEVDPDGVSICHCTDCQTLTGSPYRVTLPVPAGNFRMLQGTPRIYVKTAESGNLRAQAFCGDCGTPIYAAAPTNPTSYSLRVGAIKQRAQLGRPKRQIWCRSALSWPMDITGIEQHERG
jgi:hypothetical protein